MDIRELAELAEKYRTLTTLRARREQLEDVGRAGFSDDEGKQRRQAFAKIAAKFPGALRELEVTSAAVLGQKAARVEQTLVGVRGNAGHEIPAWMQVVNGFHRTLGEALAVKLWLAQNSFGDQDARWQACVPWHASREWHGLACPTTREQLAIYARPPNGRLLAIVWTALEREFGMNRDELKKMVFG